MEKKYRLSVFSVVLFVCVALCGSWSNSRGDIFSKLLKLSDHVVDLERGALRSLDNLLVDARRVAHLLPHKGRGAFILKPAGEQLQLVGLGDDGQIVTVVVADLWTTLVKHAVADLLIPEEYFDDVRFIAPYIPSTTRLHLMHHNGLLLPIQVTSDRGKVRLLVVVDNRLYLDLERAADINDFEEIVRTHVGRSDTEVISLFDPREVDIVRLLDEAIGDAHSALLPGQAAQWLKGISTGRDRLLLIVGHVEDQSFVMRGVDGEVLARVGLDEVVVATRHSGSGVILLGCETAGPGRSGFLSPVNVTAVADALRLLQTGGTLGELLAVLAKVSPDGLVITRALLDDVTAIVMGRAKSAQSAKNRQLLFDYARIVIPRSAATDTVPTMAGGTVSAILFLVGIVILNVISTFIALWLLGFINSIFIIHSLWRDWRDAGIRFIIFISFIPFLIGVESVYFILIVVGACLPPIVLEHDVASLSLIAYIYVGIPVVWIYLFRQRSWFNTLQQNWLDIVALIAVGFGLPILAEWGMGWLNGWALYLLYSVELLTTSAVSAFFIKLRYRTGGGPYFLPIGSLYLLLFPRPREASGSIEGRRVFRKTYFESFYND